MRLSVCIVHWNTTPDLVRCLDALAAHPSTRGAQEVIVVDNASDDGAIETLARSYPTVRCIANPVNEGYARATNQAIRAATGDLLLLLNPDARVTAGALDALREHLDRNPDCAVVAPRLVWPDGRTQDSVRPFPTPCALLTGTYRRYRFDYDRPGPAPQPMASCLLLRRAAYETVGPMDERFPLFFNDVDWSLRAQRAGLVTCYTPAATVIHDHGGTTGRVRSAALWESRRAWLRFWKKHYRNDPLRPLARILVILDAWRRTGRWGESLGRDGGETTPESLRRELERERRPA